MVLTVVEYYNGMTTRHEVVRRCKFKRGCHIQGPDIKLILNSMTTFRRGFYPIRRTIKLPLVTKGPMHIYACFIDPKNLDM